MLDFLMLLILAIAVFVLLIVKKSRRVSPDCVVVFFSDKTRQNITRWQRGGLAIVWPWMHTGILHMQALTLHVSVQNPPLCLSRGEPLRFVFAIEENHKAIHKASKVFLNLSPDEIISKVNLAVARHLEGLQVSALQVDRKHFEAMLEQNIRQTLQEMGLLLVSSNFDGIFGDAPEIRYCVADDAHGG